MSKLAHSNEDTMEQIERNARESEGRDEPRKTRWYEVTIGETSLFDGKTLKIVQDKIVAYYLDGHDDDTPTPEATKVTRYESGIDGDEEHVFIGHSIYAFNNAMAAEFEAQKRKAGYEADHNREISCPRRTGRI